MRREQIQSKRKLDLALAVIAATPVVWGSATAYAIKQGKRPVTNAIRDNWKVAAAVGAGFVLHCLSTVPGFRWYQRVDPILKAGNALGLKSTWGTVTSVQELVRS